MRALLPLTCVILLGGCNWLGNVSGLNREANEAIGASCRQTGRSLEECFLRHPEADRAQVYAGWRGMNEYMTKNNLTTMAPPADPKPAEQKASAKEGSSSRNRAERYADAESDAGKPDPEVEAVLRNLRSGKPSSISQAQEGELGRVLSIINDPSLAPPTPPGGKQ